MKSNQELNRNQQARFDNIFLLTSSIGLLGSIGGVIYAHKTGGHFWRYVGYFILGGMITGIPARIVALPFENKIIKEAQDNEETKDETSSQDNLKSIIDERLNEN